MHALCYLVIDMNVHSIHSSSLFLKENCSYRGMSLMPIAATMIYYERVLRCGLTYNCLLEQVKHASIFHDRDATCVEWQEK